MNSVKKARGIQRKERKTARGNVPICAQSTGLDVTGLDVTIVDIMGKADIYSEADCGRLKQRRVKASTLGSSSTGAAAA
jgi:hypothetical protein